MERINVLSDGSLDQKWLLRDVGDAFSEFMQSHLLKVLPVDQDSTSADFGKTEEDLEDRGFTSAGSSYDSNFHTSLDEAVQINKRGLHALSVFHRHILKLDVSLDRPVFLGELFVYRLNLFVF